MLSDAFNKFKQAPKAEVAKPMVALPQQPQPPKANYAEENDENRPTRTSGTRNYKQQLRDREERNEKQAPFTMCFTNCGPELTEEQLETLVCHKLDIPVLCKRKDGKQYLMSKDGKLVEITEAPKFDLKVEACYFRADNYTKYDKNNHEHIEIQKEMYKTKVGFVLFNKKVTDEMIAKTKVIVTKSRSLFSQRSLRDPINKVASVFVTGIRIQTDLQKLINYLQKCCDNYQPTNKVTNVKTFYEDQKILGYAYVELIESPNENFNLKVFNREIMIPNEVKLLKCLGEKKAHKKVEKIQRNKQFRQNMEKRKERRSNVEEKKK
ncbi:Conserved_hypothetical protein [Hexamita inflata]|uniref:Uncharacterized protein n=1 Tax=Hexamita inflata TaxID=28002 RepID=A0AA86TJ58_9EUKA|nr:Conserved hypothetical protein [Hexamita inflata]CAI9919645.1 Conserved hypothetical protein [Hexamita inflata]